MTDMYDEWDEDPDDFLNYRHQRRLSDPSASLNNYSRYGWKTKPAPVPDHTSKAMSQNEGLDSLANEVSEIEAGDLKDGKSLFRIYGVACFDFIIYFLCLPLVGYEYSSCLYIQYCIYFQNKTFVSSSFVFVWPIFCLNNRFLFIFYIIVIVAIAFRLIPVENYFKQE